MSITAGTTGLASLGIYCNTQLHVKSVHSSRPTDTGRMELQLQQFGQGEVSDTFVPYIAVNG